MSPRDLLLDASVGVELTVLFPSCANFGYHAVVIADELFCLLCLGAFPLDGTANSRKILGRSSRQVVKFLESLPSSSLSLSSLSYPCR